MTDDSTQGVLTSPDYQVLLDSAAKLTGVPDPLPELQCLSGSSALEPDDDVGSNNANRAVLRLLSSKPLAAPDITRFPPALEIAEDGTRRFLAPVGAVVVHNKHASELDGRPYLQTVKGRVIEIDEEKREVVLFDLDRHHASFVSIDREDPKNIRWPGRKDDLASVGKRKRGRPRKIRTPEELRAIQELAERRARGEIKRGRPRKIRTPDGQ